MTRLTYAGVRGRVLVYRPPRSRHLGKEAVDGNRCEPLPHLARIGSDVGSAEMAAVLVEDGDGENLRVDAVSDGRFHEGRKFLDPAELRNRAGGRLERPELCFEQPTVPLLAADTMPAVARFLRLAPAQRVWACNLAHILNS